MKVVEAKGYSSSSRCISELWSITCHMQSHSVTCHPMPVDVPWLNSSLMCQLVLNLPALERWKAELTLVVDYIPRWFTVCIPSPIQLVIRPPWSNFTATN